MNRPDIPLLLKKYDQNPDKQCRVYMYAVFSGSRSSQLETLAWTIQENNHLSFGRFHDLVQKQYDRWSLKIEEMNEFFMHSAWIASWMDVHDSLFSSKNLSRNQAYSLWAHFLCMILQQVSILTFKNHLKKKDAERLLEILTNPNELGCELKSIERPFLKVMEGKISPTSCQYLEALLCLTEAVSFYYVSLYEGFQGGMQVSREVIHEFRKHNVPKLHRPGLKES